MIDPIIADEPSYDIEEQEADKIKITELLNYINANILKQLVNLPLAQRDSIMAKLDELSRILSIPNQR